MKKNSKEYRLGLVAPMLGAGLQLALCGQVAALPDGQDEGGSRGVRVDQQALTRAEAVYGNLPLSFVENLGQIDPQVVFYSQSVDHAVYISRDGVALSLRDGTASAVVRLLPVGANRNPEIAGVQRLPGQVNYLVGKDSGDWKTHIPTYEAVLYKEIYPGIDLKLYGNKRQLEYDFILRPGADPSVLEMAVEGIQGVAILDSGDLELAVGKETIVEKRPVIYQNINGRRIEIPGKYRLLAQQADTHQQYVYGFEVGAYDKSQTLVIDPVLSYSTYLGGKRMDIAYAIAVDKLGHAYVGGRAVSDGVLDATAALDNAPGFPVTAGVIQPHHADFKELVPDGFISKFNLDGTGLVYSTYLGGRGDPQYNNPVDPKIPGSIAWNNSGTDAITAIALDPDGNAFVAGYTSSSSFPVTNGVFQAAITPGDCSTTAGRVPCADIFVAKLNHDGSGLLYATYVGGSGDDQANGIALDNAGNAYVTGYTTSGNFPVTPGAFQRVRAGSCPVAGTDYTCFDAFVLKLNGAGSALVYSTLVGGSGNDHANGIALDARRNAYVAGGTNSSDFPTTGQAYQPKRSKEVSTAFVARLNQHGTRLDYSTYLGGNNGSDEAKGIAVNPAGNAYVVGFTDASDFPVTPGVFGAARQAGQAQAFVTKFNKSGSSLGYSTLLGGAAKSVAGAMPMYTYGHAIAIDGKGNAYITGMTNAVDFPLVNPIKSFIPNFGAFVAMINPAATKLLFSTLYGGSNGHAIAVDHKGSIYFAGNSSSENIPLINSLQKNYAGGGDAFVAKIGFDSMAARPFDRSNLMSRDK